MLHWRLCLAGNDGFAGGLLRSAHREVLVLLDLVRLEDLTEQASLRRLFDLLLNVVPEKHVAVLRGADRVLEARAERTAHDEVLVLVALDLVQDAAVLDVHHADARVVRRHNDAVGHLRVP